MRPLSRADLVDLDRYEQLRASLRDALIAHKKPRRVSVGDRVTFIFEDRETIRFQVQEMARVERIREPARLQQELDVYNDLVPADGALSATLMIEIPDLGRVRPELDRLIGLDEHVALQIGSDEVRADFDPKQLEDDRISAVHYVRFALDSDQRERFLDPDVPVALAIRHPHYSEHTVLSHATRRSLAVDLTGEPASLLAAAAGVAAAPPAGHRAGGEALAEVGTSASPRGLVLRLAARWPLTPPLLGVAAGLSLLIAYVAGWAISGAPADLFGREAGAPGGIPGRLILVNSIIIGVLAGGQLGLARLSRRQLEGLGQDGHSALGSAAGSLAALVGALVFAASLDSTRFLRQPGFDTLWHPLLVVIQGALAGRLAYALVTDARAVSRAGSLNAAAHWLDRRGLAPCVRQALGGVFLAMLYLCASSLHQLSYDAGLEGALVLVGSLALASCALLLPVLGPRRQLHRVREAKLARVRQAIGEREAGLLGATGAQPGGLADLLAYERRLVETGSWPFEAPDLIRTALYLALGVGSWIGAATVERLLERVL